MLTPDQIAQYQRDGFLVIPGFKTAAEIATLRRRAEQIVDEFDPASTRSVFSTVDQEKTTDDYVLRSDNTNKC